MRLDVVDLSHHNADPDFERAKTNGLIGVIHKATEGTSFTDEDYHARKQGALDAGLKWSSYHFLRHGNVQKQIDFYVNFIEPVPGERVCIDYEASDCTLDDLREAVLALREVDPSLEIAIYSGHLLKEQLGNQNDELLGSCSLWIAQYNSSGPSWPQGTWPTYTLWQYSDGTSGGSPKNMPGVVAPHDCNEFNGSPENCERWFGPAGAEPVPPEPEPEPEPKVVTVNIDAPEGVTVIVNVNGEPS